MKSDENSFMMTIYSSEVLKRINHKRETLNESKQISLDYAFPFLEKMFHIVGETLKEVNIDCIDALCKYRN